MSEADEDSLEPCRKAFQERLLDHCRDLEGSTHGGAKHAMVYASIRDIVAKDPDWTMASLRSMPRSAHTVLLTAFSGIGRAVLPVVLRCLASDQPEQRHDAAMVLCIWATRGYLSGADRNAIETARQGSPHREPSVESIIDSALARLRT
ncbi:MAG: hypothetical protein AAGD07_01850 [Planctomycetota bacterium]